MDAGPLAPNDNETLCSRGLAAPQVSERASVTKEPSSFAARGRLGVLHRAYDYRRQGVVAGSTISFRWRPLALIVRFAGLVCGRVYPKSGAMTNVPFHQTLRFSVPSINERPF
jgi:hypothetical protein